MKKLMFALFSSCLMFVQGLSAAEIKDTTTGVTFPEEVTFEANGNTYTLNATGVATRKKFFVKVYSVASYLSSKDKVNRADFFDKILEPGVAKQLTIKWVRAADEKRIRDGYQESFKKILGQEYAPLEADISKFVQFFGPVSKGDEQEIRWLPDNTIVLIQNGQEKGKIQGEAFAKALWSIWFGRASVVNRDDLVSSLK